MPFLKLSLNTEAGLSVGHQRFWKVKNHCTFNTVYRQHFEITNITIWLCLRACLLSVSAKQIKSVLNGSEASLWGTVFSNQTYFDHWQHIYIKLLIKDTNLELCLICFPDYSPLYIFPIQYLSHRTYTAAVYQFVTHQLHRDAAVKQTEWGNNDHQVCITVYVHSVIFRPFRKVVIPLGNCIPKKYTSVTIIVLKPFTQRHLYTYILPQVKVVCRTISE